MQFTEQHEEAIAQTVQVRNEVSAQIFDDKVRSIGKITVEGGKITIVLDNLPMLVSQEDSGEFLADSIALGIKACWKARQEAFERF